MRIQVFSAVLPVDGALWPCSGQVWLMALAQHPAVTALGCPSIVKEMRFPSVDSGAAVRLGAGLLLAFIFVSASAQDPVLKTRTKEEREERFDAAHRITMNIQVTDDAGNAVSDLRAGDFSLYDNGRQSKITAFHAIDGAAMNDATTVVILLDAVNTPQPAIDQEKDAIFRYLAESRKPLAFPTAFALWFNGHISSTSATKDRNAIGRAFVKLTKNVHSNACEGSAESAQQKISVSKSAGHVDRATCRAVHFKDSVSALDGIAQAQLATGGRTLLIWMGAGWPALSDAEVRRLSTEQQKSYTDEFVTLLHDLQAAQVSVYAIGSESGPWPHERTNAGTKISASDHLESLSPGSIAVDEFARRTGGRVIAGSADLVSDLHRCIRDADWYYSISFNAPPAKNRASELHSIEIKVDRPGAEVRTMNSYYSEP